MTKSQKYGLVTVAPVTRCSVHEGLEAIPPKRARLCALYNRLGMRDLVSHWHGYPSGVSSRRLWEEPHLMAVACPGRGSAVCTTAAHTVEPLLVTWARGPSMCSAKPAHAAEGDSATEVRRAPGVDPARLTPRLTRAVRERRLLPESGICAVFQGQTGRPTAGRSTGEDLAAKVSPAKVSDPRANRHAQIPSPADLGRSPGVHAAIADRCWHSTRAATRSGHPLDFAQPAAVVPTAVLCAPARSAAGSLTDARARPQPPAPRKTDYPQRQRLARTTCSSIDRMHHRRAP